MNINLLNSTGRIDDNRPFSTKSRWSSRYRSIEAIEHCCVIVYTNRIWIRTMNAIIDFTIIHIAQLCWNLSLTPFKLIFWWWHLMRYRFVVFFCVCHHEICWSCYEFSNRTFLFLICFWDFIETHTERERERARVRRNAELLSDTFSYLSLTLLITPSVC